MEINNHNTSSNIPQKRKLGGLGKGLAALLTENNTVEEADVVEVGKLSNAVNEIEISQIEVNPYQPRLYFEPEALKELSDSIKVQGIIQPITVRKLADRQYQLISGERRLQASKIAGLTAIPAYVKVVNDQQMVEMALIENIQREDLNPLEISLSYQRLISECNLKQEELGERVGKNRSTVNNYLRLLKLPPDIQQAIKETKITMGHARALVNVNTIEAQLEIFSRILREGLSVRKVEDLVRLFNKTDNVSFPVPKKEAITSSVTPELKEVENKLVSHFGTRVQIKTPDGEKGEIRIPYINTEDLNRILDLLNI